MARTTATAPTPLDAVIASASIVSPTLETFRFRSSNRADTTGAPAVVNAVRFAPNRNLRNTGYFPSRAETVGSRSNSINDRSDPVATVDPTPMPAHVDALFVTDANFVHQSVSDPSSTFNELTGVVPASNPAGVTAINGESSNTNSPSVTVRNPLPDGGPDPAVM